MANNLTNYNKMLKSREKIRQACMTSFVGWPYIFFSVLAHEINTV